MTLELVPQPVLRALRYIELLNRYGQSPTGNQVDEFAASNGPTPASNTMPWAGTLSVIAASILRAGLITEGETVSDYLARMDWAEADALDGFKLTRLGRAFLAGARQEEAELGDQEAIPRTVILDPQDPMSQVELAQATSNAGAGMLLDPFLKPESLLWLVGSTHITKVLIKPPKGGLGPHQMALGYTVGSERIELRVTKSTEFHDRAIVGEEGSVTLIGSSVNGIGRHLTTLVSLSAADGKSLRKRFEALFDEAEPVVPVRTDGEKPRGAEDAEEDQPQNQLP